MSRIAKYSGCTLVSRSAVTLIELIIAVLILSLLFGSAYGIMRYSRSETEKGFWIQKTITQLRNSTRAITQKLKKTSYPTTIIKKLGENQKVISFKEKRTYYDTGRLKKIEINDDENFDMHAMVTDGAILSPTFSEQSIMYFPVCTPEYESPSGYEEGIITWVELVLTPGKNYRTNGLGSLRMIERTETYNTKTISDRAFGFSSTFSRSLPVKTDKELVSDVRDIEIEYFEIEQLRGVYFQGEDKVEEHNKKILVSMTIACSHPRDGKIWLSDRCAVINNVGIVKLDTGSLMALIKINSSGPGGSAIVQVGTDENTVTVGSAVGSFRVKSILSDSVVLTLPDSDIERHLVLKDS
jgi:prepilin-type N-terminal cleavage/methylation domain-containing protein